MKLIANIVEPPITGFKIININIFFVPVWQIYLQYKKCNIFYQTMGEGLGAESAPKKHTADSKCKHSVTAMKC